MEFSPTNSAREDMQSGQQMSHSQMNSGAATTTRKEGRGGIGGVSRLLPLKFLLVLLLIGEALLVWLVIDPPYLRQQTIANEVIGEVSRLTAVNINEQPQVAVVADPDTLRKANDIQGQVYKDAAKGDYVIVYSDQMIIYRRNDNKVVYVGDSPAALATKTQNALVTAITGKAKDAKLIASDSTETPQLSAVTDAAVVRTQDPSFYANVAKDDVIALFPSAKIIILYRPSTGNMINSGTFNTVISAR